MGLITYLPRTMPTLGGDQLYLQQELAAIANAIGALNNALSPSWTAYTPGISPDTGAFGSASATGRYLKIGKTVNIQLYILITTVGTASGYLNIGLPFNTAGACVISGWENNATGRMCQGNAYTSVSYLNVRMFDNASPIVANYHLLLGGVYECV
jgi:hypothetical protein